MTSFSKNSLSLISGNATAQIISIVTMPIITRLYSPDEFGVFAVFVSCLAILGPLSTLRFNEVIILPKDQGEALNIFALSWLSSVIFSILVLAIILISFLSTSLYQTFNIRSYQLYFLLIPLGILFRGSTLTLNSFAIRQASFKKIAVSGVVSRIGNRFSAIILGHFTRLGPWGLITARLTEAFISISFLYWFEFRHLLNEFRQRVSLSELKRLAVKYKEFPIYGSGSIFLHTSAREMVVFILISLFSPTAAGGYALCQNIIRQPLVMVGSSLNRVFRQRAIQIKDDSEKLVKETSEIVSYLCYLILPLILILTFLGDILFILFFGENWHEAGKYVQILAPSFFFIFLYTTLRAFFIIFELPQKRLLFDVIYFSLRGGSLLLAGLLFKTPEYALLAMSVATCIHIYFFFLYIGQLLHNNKYCMINIIFKKIVMMLPLIFGLGIIRLFFAYETIPAVSLFLLSLSIQGLLVFYTDSSFRKKVIHSAFKIK